VHAAESFWGRAAIHLALAANLAFTGIGDPEMVFNLKISLLTIYIP
jgi:hypothetical protein